MPDFPNELVEAAARAFHENYERLAPDYGYKTREASAVAWEGVPEENRSLMLATVAAVLPLIEQRARLDERERLSSRVHENGWCPTCARDTDEAAMQRLAGKPAESLSRTDLIGLALRNLSAAMDAEARAAEAEQRVIDRLAREAGENPVPDEAGTHRPSKQRSRSRMRTQKASLTPLRKLRVRAAEMLPEVARFTLDEIEAILGHAAPGICCAPHCWSEYGTPCGDCPADAERERQSDE